MATTAPRQIPLHRTFRVLPGGRANGGTVVADRGDVVELLCEQDAFCAEVGLGLMRIWDEERSRPVPAFTVLSEAQRLIRRAVVHRRGLRMLVGQIDRGPASA